MNAAIRSLMVGFALASAAPYALASTRVAVYAIVDGVSFEPSELDAERAWISGIFVVPRPVSSGLHLAPQRGHLYVELNVAAPRSTRSDWAALRAAAGTGQVVGFGAYWMPCENRAVSEPRIPPNTNCSFEITVHQDRSAAKPEQYPLPSSDGVVTRFDSGDDVCPRFGRSSVQIVADLREAYAPGGARHEVPVCADGIGLVAPSDLDTAFAAQTRDPEWAAATEELLLARLARVADLQLSSVLVECRETICRVSLVFPSHEYQTARGNELASNALNELPAFAPGGKIIPAGAEPTLSYYFQRRKPSVAQPAPVR